MGEPGELSRTASDAASLTFEARDPEGIYRISAFYRTRDNRYSAYRDAAVPDCPGRWSATFPRRVRKHGETLLLVEVSVIDCDHRNTGKHGVTSFAVDGEGRPERIRIQERPFDNQKIIEALGELGDELDAARKRQTQLRLLLLLMLLLIWWWTLGPFFR